MDVVEARTSLLSTLDRTPGAEDLAKRLRKCGQKMVLRCHGCDEPREIRTRCDLKWCPTCQRALAARATDRYKRVMAAASIQWPLFVTFTVQHDAADDFDLMREVRRAHTKLRRLRWFKQRVKGGIVAFEITGSAGQLHPHVHALLDCRWLSVTVPEPKIGSNKEQWSRISKRACSEVAAQWELCVGRKASVKVRRVWKSDGGDIGGAVAEVIKYSMKGADLADMAEEQPAQAVECIRMLDRTRMLCSFGTLYRHPEIKRQKASPALCTCGCSDWLPESVANLMHRIAVSGRR